MCARWLGRLSTQVPSSRPSRNRGRARWIEVSILTGFLVCSAAATATAESDGVDHSRSGPYLSISGLWITDMYENELEDQLTDAFGPVNVDVENSGAISARAGMRLLPILALELQYDWVAEYEAEFDVPGIPTEDIALDIRQQTLTANARVNIPLGRVQPFVLAGIGFQHFELEGRADIGTLRLREDVSDTVLAGRVGAGVEVFVTEHIGLILEGTVVLTNEEFEVNGETINNLFYGGAGLGLTYRF